MPENVWTLLIALTIPTMLVSGCVSVGSGEAICDGTEALRRVHAQALVADGGDQSVVTGQALIATLDAGCGAGK